MKDYLRLTALVLVMVACSSTAGCESGDGVEGAGTGGGGTGGSDPSCPAKQVKCGDPCVSLSSSVANCGACDTACLTAQSCDAGACTCPGDLATCADSCVDTSASLAHCGSCGNACATRETCNAGNCECEGEREACSGSCVELLTDPANCGHCGTACTTAEVCNAGECTTGGCGGLTQCGQSCVDVQTDEDHCGGCDNACVQGHACVSGSCGCPSGKIECGGLCVDPLSDIAHCGHCNTACTGGQICNAGTCKCEGGNMFCGASGCVDTDTNASHCGACPTSCGAGEACEGGVCTPGGTDECDSTADCKGIYGAQATDCVNSGSNQSWCDCGAARCADLGGTGGSGGSSGAGGAGGSGGTGGSSGAGGAGVDAPTETVVYVANSDSFLNPERGFYRSVNLLQSTDLSSVRTNGCSLARSYIRLDDYRTSNIPASVLSSLETGLNAARSAGIKVIPRVAYNFSSGAPDASKSWVLNHISQLAPVYQKHADVIAVVEAGFIGAWGEWHSSTNNLTNPTDRQDILTALLGALPENRMVMLRYPRDLEEQFPSPLTSTAAYNKSNQARTGHHNDCFLSNSHDAGTYTPSPVEPHKVYLEQTSKFVPVGGETCSVTPSEHRSDCPTALLELARFHFTTINSGYWGNDLDRWKAEGCYNEIDRRLGYRLQFTEASLAPRVKPGGRFLLELQIQNTGFGAMYNPRSVFLVLESGGVRHQVALSGIDPRRWAPGTVNKLSVHLELPATLDPGNYALALWLPDEAPSLANRAVYAVRFANENVWNATAGYNQLGTVEISNSAPGSANPAATGLSILP